MLSFGVVIWCYYLFNVIILCYHFSQLTNVIIFPCTACVIIYVIINVIIFCYHFPPFFLFLKTWHTCKSRWLESTAESPILWSRHPRMCEISGCVKSPDVWNLRMCEISGCVKSPAITVNSMHDTLGIVMAEQLIPGSSTKVTICDTVNNKVREECSNFPFPPPTNNSRKPLNQQPLGNTESWAKENNISGAISAEQGCILHCFVWGPIRLKLLGKKNFNQFLFYHVGLLIIHEFCQGCKTYHFLVKSILNIFSRGKRSSDTLVSISAIYVQMCCSPM
jgi:hypothetical protein